MNTALLALALVLAGCLPDAPESADSGAEVEHTDCALLWYPDADADGRGDASAPITACEAPEGYVDDSLDCDDGDATTYPGAPEICQDGRVNDCDMDEATALAACELGDGVLLSEADAELIGASGHAYAGASVDSAGDTNGDGYADLLIGAPALSCHSSHVGSAAHLVLGPVTGALNLGDADATLTAEDDCDDAGDTVRGAGDLDGDGFDDALIGAPENHAKGAVYVLFGPVSGSFGLAEADARLSGADTGDQAGDSLSPAGDVDGDGELDLLIGASAEGTAAAESGAAYLVLGPVTAERDLSESDAALYAEATWDYAGKAVAGGGDVDADGYDDLLVGAYNTGGAQGTAYLQLGPVSGSHSLGDADLVLESENGSAKAGLAVALAGDVDGDGKDDLVIGAPGEWEAGSTPGAAYLLLGPASGVSSFEDATAKIIGAFGSSDAGSGVAYPGDLDGDGLDDLLIGAPGDMAGDAEPGGAWLVIGPVSGTCSITTSSTHLYGEITEDKAGYAVSGAGDVNGDGAPDLLVGAIWKHEIDAEDKTGGAYLVLGGHW